MPVAVKFQWSTNGEEFRLLPFFFAYEDREQITLLFTETLGRLAAAASIRKGIACKPSDLWEKIFALMSDWQIHQQRI